MRCHNPSFLKAFGHPLCVVSAVLVLCPVLTPATAQRLYDDAWYDPYGWFEGRDYRFPDAYDARLYNDGYFDDDWYYDTYAEDFDYYDLRDYDDYIFDYYRTNDVYRYGNDFEELYNYGPD